MLGCNAQLNETSPVNNTIIITATLSIQYVLGISLHFGVNYKSIMVTLVEFRC